MYKLDILIISNNTYFFKNHLDSLTIIQGASGTDVHTHISCVPSPLHAGILHFLFICKPRTNPVSPG